jgi:predicted dehydrogenase
VGSKGEAYAPKFIQAHLDDRIIVTVNAEQREEFLGSRSTYTYQLEALTELIRNGVPMRTDADDAVITMQMIDGLYKTARMDRRVTS